MEKSYLIKEIQDAAFEVRKALKDGYLESVYQNALIHELKLRRIQAEKEVAIPVYYKQHVVGDFRADILVDERIIIELKVCKEISPIHEAQLVNYLTATGLDIGFLINYGEPYRFIKKTRVYNPSK